MVKFEYGEYLERIDRLQQLLIAKRVDLAILNLNCELYYFLGTALPLYLLIPAEGPAVAVARKAVEQIRAEAPEFRTEVFQDTKDLARIISSLRIERLRRMGFVLGNTSFAAVNRWLQLVPEAEPVDISQESRKARMVKSTAELAVYREAGRLMAGLPKLVEAEFRPGMTELELSAIIENFMRLNGHSGLARCHREGIEMVYGVCAAGVSALAGTKFDGISAGSGLTPAVPYGAGLKRINRNEPVLLDYAFNFQGYHLDQTRMFCWGEPSPEVMKAFKAMLQVEELLISELRPGNSWSEVYEKSLRLAEKLGYQAGFMGLGNEKVRFVGHGVGLELDEPPFLAPKMEETFATGMTVALEPKVALAGIGVVGNEDTVAITESGVEWITTAPREMIIIG